MELDTGIKRHYCFYDEIYDPDSKAGKRRVNLLAELVEEYLEPEGGIALDIGCGMGVSSAALIKGGYDRAVGIDIQEDYISKAKAWSENTDLKLEFRLMDIRKPSFESSSFDGIAMLSNPLPHWNMNEMDQIAKNCFDLLKPGGWLMIHYLDWVGLLYSGYKDVLVEETEAGHLISHHAELNTIQGYARRLYTGPSDPRGFSVKLRLWSPWILGYLLEKAGFVQIETEYPLGNKVAITTCQRPL